MRLAGCPKMTGGAPVRLLQSRASRSTLTEPANLLVSSKGFSVWRTICEAGRGRARCRLHRQLSVEASVMIEKLAAIRGLVWNEFLDLNHTSKTLILVSLMIPKFARDTGGEAWRTSESGH